MSADANAATAKRVLEEAFSQGQVDILDEICASDYVGHDPADPEDTRSIEAAKERARMYKTAMSDLEVTADDIVACDDKVVMRWTARGTNDGELMGMPPTGKRVEITGMSIDRFDADGKIAETWDQWDNAGFMTQLGVTPEMAGQAG